MGQPITVVEKPSPTPGIVRFEINRSLTGMSHERYTSVDDILDDRPVDELARRLFASGGVTEVHANGSVVTVHLADGWSGERLLDVIRGLYVFYPSGGSAPGGHAPSAVPDADPDAAAAPEQVTDEATAVAASEAVTEPVDDRVTGE
ncbi:MAG TPA: hypothetical protein VFW63_00850 [Acidimicrobiales bacterium]|nr:hypothetical protein [Acidimicrobiales bacterium]